MGLIGGRGTMEILTIRETAKTRSGSEYWTGEVIRYEVEGLPRGEAGHLTQIGGHNRRRWQILTVKDDVSSGWFGEYLSADEALTILKFMRSADEIAQDTVNAFGVVSRAGQWKETTSDMTLLLDRAC